MSRRLIVSAAVFGVSAVLIAHRAEPVAAQNPKEAAQQLRAELAQANKAIATLKQQVVQLQNQNAKLQGDLKKTSSADDKTARGLQATINGYQNAGLVHVVVLKLKSDSSSGEVQSVIDDVNNTLAKVKPVRGVWVGKPSANGTPDIAATDYDLAFAMVFDDSKGLQQYLKDPQHKKFVDKHIAKWETRVFDFEPRKPAGP